MIIKETFQKHWDTWTNFQMLFANLQKAIGDETRPLSPKHLESVSLQILMTFEVLDSKYERAVMEAEDETVTLLSQIFLLASKNLHMCWLKYAYLNLAGGHNITSTDVKFIITSAMNATNELIKKSSAALQEMGTELQKGTPLH